MALKRQGRPGMLLVYFFGVHAFAWVAKKSVMLWNEDVDVPGDKRPLLQRLALEEAYTWQKDALTKPPTRRRNPETVKPKHDSKAQETLKAERLNLLTALKSMYKQQVKEAKLEKAKARAAARGEELPEDYSVSSDDEDETASRKSAGKDVDEEDELSNDDAQSIASSVKSKSSKQSSAKSSVKGNYSTPKAVDKSKKANSALQSPSAAETPNTAQSEEDEDSGSDGEKGDHEGDEDEQSSDIDPSIPDVPDLGADELTEIDLSSAIQRGKFILRASKNESLPPKKRKYTRRVPLNASGSSSHHNSSTHHQSSNGGDASDEEGHDTRSSKKSKKSHHKTPTKSTQASSSHIPQRSSARLANSESVNVSSSAKDREELSSSAVRDRDGSSKSGSILADGATTTEQDELEALKLANTIAARRKLRRSGHQASQDEEVLSLPLPTRQRAKPGSKEAGNAANNSDGQPTSSSPQPNASTSPVTTIDLSEEGETEATSIQRPIDRAQNSGSATGHVTLSANNTATNGSTNANPKKTGRGKYIRKGKRDANSDSLPEPLCAACATARPNSTRHSLGLFMFYMLEDHIASQRSGTPRYHCLSHRCGQSFYTEGELKQHLRTHFERIQKLFTEPPTKKRKVAEESDSRPNAADSNHNHSNKVVEDSHSDQNTAVSGSSSSEAAKKDENTSAAENVNSGDTGASMDVDADDLDNKNESQSKDKVDGDITKEDGENMDVDHVSGSVEQDVAPSASSSLEKVYKEVTYYQCDYEGCTTTTDEEEDGAFFSSLSELHAHVTKVHCGGITQRPCSRCGTKNVYALAPVTTIAGRAARAKNSASVSSHYAHGRGRMLPFEPLQGIAPPNMISLPLQNLSYQPPPTASPSPAVLAVPHFATAAHAHAASLAQQQMHLPLGLMDPHLVAMGNVQMAPTLSAATPHFTPQQLATIQSGHPIANGHAVNLPQPLQQTQQRQAMPLSLMNVASVDKASSNASDAASAAGADDNDSSDRPKRSTRIRRSSAAAQQMQATQLLSSPYGHLSSKQARAAAQEAREAARAAKAMGSHPSHHSNAANHLGAAASFASAVGSSAPHHVATGKHASPAAAAAPTAQAPPKKKKGSIYSVSSPMPSALPTPAAAASQAQPTAATRNHPTKTETQAPAAGEGGTDMGALLDLINLCSSIVE